MASSTSTTGLGFYGQDFFIIKTDEDLVSESIIRLIMTNNNERCGHPELGGNLKNMLFEQMDDTTIQELEKSLSDLIEVYEPRATIQSLTITANRDENQMEIKIGFKYVGRPNSDTRFLDLIIS